MLASIPERLYSRWQKMEIFKSNAEKYVKAKKKEKRLILDDLSKILHMNRNYIALLLRRFGKVIYFNGAKCVPEYEERVHNRGRKKIYTQELVPYLAKIWWVAGYPSSKHLYHYMRCNSDKLFASPELADIPEEFREKLLKMSPATIDRLLKPIRDKLKLKGKYKTNPYNSSIKKSVQVESWFDKQKEPGTVELDLLYHSGESAKGEFAFTLVMTEIATDWTELTALKNKARVWTIEATKKSLQDMPIPIKRIHVDNGSEFLNAHMCRFCLEEGIELRRSRPYRKNDAPYVESKNWSLVRRYTGWRRYDTDAEYEILSELLNLISLKHNLFEPTMKLKFKERKGGKVKKTYDFRTPYERVLSLECVPEDIKQKLKSLREEVDIFELARKIEELEKKLDKAYQIKVRRYNDE
ncbi:MAG: transposase [Fervidicoccus sp.]|nr:MAG: transposase [Fervidicoccus sp.]